MSKLEWQDDEQGSKKGNYFRMWRICMFDMIHLKVVLLSFAIIIELWFASIVVCLSSDNDGELRVGLCKECTGL